MKRTNIKNIKVLLMGGGGNQLFQLARAWSLKNQDMDCCLLHFGKATPFVYKVAGLTLHRDWLETELLATKMGITVQNCNFKDALCITLVFLVRKFFRLLSKNIFDLELEDTVRFYREGKKFPYDIGYFQSPCHLAPGAIEAVANALVRHHNIVINPDAAKELTVHLRGGDFEPHERHGDETVKTINKIAQTHGLKTKIITNDKPFFEQLESKGLNGSLPNTNSARDDFCYLGGSKNLVLSNSTFSFWAAACSASIQQPNIYIAPTFAQKELLSINLNILKGVNH